MFKSYLLTFGLLLCAAGAAQADTTYQVFVNTSNLAGKTGSLDFQFNFGSGALQAANVTVSNFTGGANGTGTSTGQVSGGPLPAAVTLGNGYPASGYNDYFETYTYGSALKFSLDFSGPAVNAPYGSSSGNSEFYFSMFSDPNGTTPAPGTDTNGVAGTAVVNPDGSITTNSVSPNLSFSPEPGSLWLTLGAGLMLGVAFVRRRATS